MRLRQGMQTEDNSGCSPGLLVVSGLLNGQPLPAVSGKKFKDAALLALKIDAGVPQQGTQAPLGTARIKGLQPRPLLDFHTDWTCWGYTGAILSCFICAGSLKAACGPPTYM